MSEKARTYAYIALTTVIGAFLWHKYQHGAKKDRLIVGGVGVSKVPCMELLNGLFGKAVDSSKACDCLLSGCYESVKHDKVALAAFYDSGLNSLSGPYRDTFGQLFQDCTRQYILDSTAKITLSGSYLESFKRSLARRIRNWPSVKGNDPDSVASCVAKELNHRLTILEYTGLKAWDEKIVQAAMDRCIIRAPWHQ